MNKELLVKRLKSFAWRLGGMAVVAGLNFVAENLGLTGLSPAVVAVIGLGVGELTKALNTYFTARSSDLSV